MSDRKRTLDNIWNEQLISFNFFLSLDVGISVDFDICIFLYSSILYHSVMAKKEILQHEILHLLRIATNINGKYSKIK